MCLTANTAIFPAKLKASTSEPYFMIDMIAWRRSGASFVRVLPAKARPCALEAAIIAIAVTGEHMQFDCQAARKDCGPRSRNFDQASRK
jgi:hypothetical protein